MIQDTRLLFLVISFKPEQILGVAATTGPCRQKSDRNVGTGACPISTLREAVLAWGAATARVARAQGSRLHIFSGLACRCDVGAGLAPAHGFTPSRPLRSPSRHPTSRALKFPSMAAGPCPPLSEGTWQDLVFS
jgi:hypothetical protein